MKLQSLAYPRTMKVFSFNITFTIHIYIIFFFKIFLSLKKPIRSTTQTSNAKAHELNFGTCDMYTMCGLELNMLAL
jgi:hypothetical protein